MVRFQIPTVIGFWLYPISCFNLCTSYLWNVLYQSIKYQGLSVFESLSYCLLYAQHLTFQSRKNRQICNKNFGHILISHAFNFNRDALTRVEDDFRRPRTVTHGSISVSVLIRCDVISVLIRYDIISVLMRRDVISVAVTQLCVDVSGVNCPGADGLVGGAVLHVASVETRRKCQPVADRCRYWQEPWSKTIKTFIIWTLSYTKGLFINVTLGFPLTF